MTTLRHAAWRAWATALFVSLLPLGSARAQDEPEYRMEIGGGAGLTAYLGDFNGRLTRQMRPAAGIVAKYKMNPRMAWAALLSYGTLKGSSANVDTWYAQLSERPLEFKSTLADLSLRYEYNFWAFGTGQEYHGARPLTPFIAMGAGLSMARCDGQQTTAFQVPLGLGMKYKAGNRLNLALEWTIHFTGTDRLDGQQDPYGIASSGLFKNTDCYDTLQLTLTYDVWAKCKTCHNDDL